MMSIQLDRREFVAACAGLIALPSTLLALTAEDVNQDRDMEKILRELPQAKLSGVGLKPAIAGRVKTGQVFLPASS